MVYDIFISHASEDKDLIARPMAITLIEKYNLNVWYDEFSLVASDSLTEKIDYGIANSRFGAILLSKSFIQKPWPKEELSGFRIAKIEGKSKIIPIWHQITSDEVFKFSPILKNIVALNTEKGMDYICDEISKIVGPPLENGIDELLQQSQSSFNNGDFDSSVMIASKALRQTLERIVYNRLTKNYFKKNNSINKYSLLQLLDLLHKKGGVIPQNSERQIDRNKLNNMRNVAVHGSSTKKINFKDAKKFIDDVRYIIIVNKIQSLSV